MVITRPSRALDAAKSDMTCRRVLRLGMSGGGTIAPAVVRRAEVGSALEHAPGDPDVWHPRIIAGVGVASAGIDGDAA